RRDGRRRGGWLSGGRRRGGWLSGGRRRRGRRRRSGRGRRGGGRGLHRGRIGGRRRGGRRGRRILPVLCAVVEVGRFGGRGAVVPRGAAALGAEVAVAEAGLGLLRSRGRGRRLGDGCVVLGKRGAPLGDVIQRLRRGIRGNGRDGGAGGCVRVGTRRRGGLRGARGLGLALPDLAPGKRLILVGRHVVELR